MKKMEYLLIILILVIGFIIIEFIINWLVSLLKQ